jgi:hypothetical protein
LRKRIGRWVEMGGERAVVCHWGARRVEHGKGGRLSGDEEKGHQLKSFGSTISKVKPRKEELWDTSLQGELACWVSIMEQLYNMQAAFKEVSGGTPETALFSGRRRSWDFVAPDIIRPYNNIPLRSGCGRSAVGMSWTTFQLVQGVLRAEGHDYLMNSRVLQTVGTVIDFRVVRLKGKAAEATVERWYIPESQIYRMMFGIIPQIHNSCPSQCQGFV